MTNILPINVATPIGDSISSIVSVPTGNTLSLVDWFISSKLNSDQDKVSTYKITNNGTDVFYLDLGAMTELGVFVSFLSNRNIKPTGTNWVELFNSSNSNMKCFYIIRANPLEKLSFTGGLGDYLINFINVSVDNPIYFNANWDNYGCQTAVINGLPLSQFGFQTVDYLEYNMGYSRSDKTNTTSRGHSTVQGGYDVVTNEIKLRLDFKNIPNLGVGENFYDGAMRTVTNLINFIRDGDLFVSYKQQPKVYNHCKFNQIIKVEHAYNVLNFTLELIKINCKGTTSFSLDSNGGRFNQVEFICNGNNQIISDSNDENNYLFVNGNSLVETMFNKVNSDNVIKQDNQNHFMDNSYSLHNCEILKKFYLS